MFGIKKQKLEIDNIRPLLHEGKERVYDMQFDKCFLEPIKVILECMKWKTEKVSSLEDFFN
jgi:hypothetical protein